MATFIICCGMIRSGSTLQYNLVQELLKITKKGKSIGYIEGNEIERIIKQNNDYDGYIALKTHFYFDRFAYINKKYSIKLIYVYRDFRDVIVSLMNMNNTTFEKTYNEELSNKVLSSYYDWTQYSNIYKSSYQTQQKDLVKEIYNISRYLNIEIKFELLKDINQKYSRKKQKKRISELGSVNFDNTSSLLHKNHINSGENLQWKKKLKKYQIAEIQFIWKNWFVEHDFLIQKTIYNNKKLNSLLKKTILKFNQLINYLKIKAFPFFSQTKLYKYYRKWKYKKGK